jgi:hypothetical protein
MPTRLRLSYQPSSSDGEETIYIMSHIPDITRWEISKWQKSQTKKTSRLHHISADFASTARTQHVPSPITCNPVMRVLIPSSYKNARGGNMPINIGRNQHATLHRFTRSSGQKFPAQLRISTGNTADVQMQDTTAGTVHNCCVPIIERKPCWPLSQSGKNAWSWLEDDNITNPWPRPDD